MRDPIFKTAHVLLSTRLSSFDCAALHGTVHARVSKRLLFAMHLAVGPKSSVLYNQVCTARRFYILQVHIEIVVAINTTMPPPPIAAKARPPDQKSVQTKHTHTHTHPNPPVLPEKN